MTVTLSLQDPSPNNYLYQDPSMPNSVCGRYGGRYAMVTVSITNGGNSAVSVPTGLYVNIFSTDRDGPNVTGVHVDDQELAPGNTYDATYDAYLGSLGQKGTVITKVQVSVDANHGSGSVTIPVSDSVPAGC
jgi:hypothetical protein